MPTLITCKCLADLEQAFGTSNIMVQTMKDGKPHLCTLDESTTGKPFVFVNGKWHEVIIMKS